MKNEQQKVRVYLGGIRVYQVVILAVLLALGCALFPDNQDVVFGLFGLGWAACLILRLVKHFLGDE